MGQAIIETIERFAMPRDGGGAFRISLYRPEGAFAVGSLPIVFVTDADYVFGTAAEQVGLQHASGVLAPAILVGIGYGADIFTAARLRARDLTLPMGDAARADSAMLAGLAAEAGGADAFLSFLLGPLADAVALRCPEADPAHRILFGSSLGGLFATHALFQRPEAFRAVIIGSPAIYWDRYAVLQGALGFAGRLRLIAVPPRVFIGVGGTEEDVPEEVPAGSPHSLEELREAIALGRMIGASHDLARTLRLASLAVDLMVFEGEGHQQVIPGLLNRGLRFALGKAMIGSTER